MSSLLAGAALLAFSSASWAQLTTYSSDFESTDIASPTALSDEGWVVGANVFASDGVTFLYNYFAFPAPNGGPAFSGVTSGEGGPDQGAQQITVYNDYNNADHGNGSNNRIDANFFQEQTITAADVGKTIVFSFDAKQGNIELGSTARAFLLTLDPNAGFFVTKREEVDLTAIGTDWGGFSLSLTIDASQPGQILQFGFANTASNFEGSGMFYDNINVGPDESRLLSPFFNDFEATDLADPDAIGNLGWLVGANVFAPDGVTFLYNYFSFPAPNGGPGFSGLVDDQGGPTQGARQITVYNDYNNADHNVGNRIEANFFQERVITGADVGETWTFSFDAKRGNIEGASTAKGFLKTLDPANGFATTNNFEIDTTDLPTEWNRYEVSITIDDSLPGQLIQWGFINVASNFEGSGNFYDNISMSPPAPDSDGDGIADDTDNCTLVANPDQRDTNGDLIGNICDADLSNNCSISFEDLGIMKSVFFTTDADADLNGNGSVSFDDLGLLKAAFFGPPGPSAAGCN
ncbi:MAG: hypothetical protein AAFN78_11960 [Pseudomonadota bacterium]